MKTHLFYSILLIGCITCAVICWQPDEVKVIIIKQPDMTIREFQQFLCDQGFPIAVDGELGNETEAAWRDYLEKRK